MVRPTLCSRNAWIAGLYRFHRTYWFHRAYRAYRIDRACRIHRAYRLYRAYRINWTYRLHRAYGGSRTYWFHRAYRIHRAYGGSRAYRCYRIKCLCSNNSYIFEYICDIAHSINCWFWNNLQYYKFGVQFSYITIRFWVYSRWILDVS